MIGWLFFCLIGLVRCLIGLVRPGVLYRKLTGFIFIHLFWDPVRVLQLWYVFPQAPRVPKCCIKSRNDMPHLHGDAVQLNHIGRVYAVWPLDT